MQCVRLLTPESREGSEAPVLRLACLPGQLSVPRPRHAELAALHHGRCTRPKTLKDQ